MYQVWWKSVDILLKLLSRNENMDMSRADTLSKNEEICPSAIPNQIFIKSIHTPSFVKIQWYLLNMKNENMDISQADNLVKNRQNLPFNNPKLDLHNINANTH